MPPKRSSDGPDSLAKKAKPDDLPQAEWFDILHVSKRWAKVSGSRNVDAEYKYATTKDGPEKAYSYQCVCCVPWARDDEDDEDDDEEEEEDSDAEEEQEDDRAEKRPRIPCDGGTTCLCTKPAEEHPDHPWIITRAGLYKFLAQRIMVNLRDPDGFGMYIYNDFFSYGAMEVLENLILDFVEAKDNWKEQWTICEALAWWLNDRSSDILLQSDDGDRVNEAMQLVGRIFLSMLALLESKNLLAETSEVKNLGVVMALFMKLAHDVRDYGVLDGDSQFEGFDDYVLAYANKFAIPLKGPDDIDELAAERDGSVKLPVATAAKPDVWTVYTAIKNFQKYHGAVGGGRGGGKIGGDRYDITAMSSAERKACSFDKKDPLGKDEIQALKNGLTLAPA